MNLKRIAASLTAMACFGSIVGTIPEFSDDTYAAELVCNNFEETYEGWYANDEMAEFAAVPGAGADGSRGMKISNRLNPDSGVSSSKGFYLTGGIEYDYSVQVYSETDETFHVSLLCIDQETNEETVVELASKNVKAGEWTEISAEYKAPKNSSEFRLTITTDSTNDFCFDNVLITEQRSKNVIVANAAGNGLKEAFNGYGFRVGNILNGNTVNNSGITANYIKDFNAIECENETKADAILVQNGSTNTDVKVSLNRCAAILDFCVKNNMGFRGHAFVWHSQTPSWFFKEGFSNNGSWVNSSTMDQRLESYIKNTFNAFATQYPTLNLYAYDVVNEAVSDDSSRTANNGGARLPGDNNTEGGKSAWVQVYGSNAFIEKAFTYARKYAPSSCKLYYNDYNEYWDHKRDCIINTIVKPLYNKGLLDGMGMQSHVPANATGFAGTDSYLQAMDMYLSVGCDVQVTELDISLENGKYSLQDQANKYKAIFQHAMEVNTSGKYKGRVTLIQVWGPNDANSWLSSGSNALLYDSSNQPKTAYNTLMQLGDGNGPFESLDGPITPPEPNEYGWWFQCGFEDGDDNWTGRGGNSVEVSDKEHYTEWGSKSLYVYDRTSEWMGASLSLSPVIYEAGESYSFSVHVKQNNEEAVDFKLSLEYTDSTGETAYADIATVTAPKGMWAQLVNTSYKIPDGATNLKIYVETTSSLTDFYMDEAIGATDGTGIAGEGQPVVKVVVRGDLNFDGKINVFDVVAARKGIIDGISDAQTKKAADVDRNNKFEAADLVLIHQYVMGKITEFPKAQVSIDVAAMEAAFSGVSILDSWKKDGENNCLWTQRFGADPGWMVYDGRLYVYTTNDAFEYSNGQIQENSYDVRTLNCFSTADLVNWTDHGAIPVAGNGAGAAPNGAQWASKWASRSWAPDACWKTIDGKDKFFLYFANNGSGIGVLTADSPTGPWTDPIGKELISRSTPNCGNVAWLFDPGVYYDETTGKAYLAFGGGKNDNSGTYADPGTGRIVELNDDMISINGTPTTINPPYLFEDSSLIKIGNEWVYSFCHNWNVPGGLQYSNADIGYMTATNPLGPYTYKGVVFKNTGSQRLDNGGNNHHSIIEFKGEYYVLYHSRQLEMRMGVNGGKGLNYRSACIDKCTVNGSSLSCNGTITGVSQIETLNPYVKVQAETMSNQSKNVKVNGLYDTRVAVGKGDWFKTSGVDFGSGAASLTMKASSSNGAVIRVCSGSANGEVLAYVEIPAGGSAEEIEVPVIESATGENDIYFVASGDAEVDWWQFAE